MNQPKVTIAIPTYNRAGFLTQAIESALFQTYPNIEVLVADNASGDDTSGVVKQFNDSRIRYFRHDVNYGLVYNWNFCLQEARGEFFLMLSDDDVLERDAIEWYVSQFDNPGVVLAYSNITYINENSQIVKLDRFNSPGIESGHHFVINRLKVKRMSMPSATLHRTDAARALGGYPPVGAATDLAMCLAIAKGGTVSFNTRPLVKYRIHHNNLSGAIKTVISSHEEFIRWSGTQGSPLYEYRDIVFRYCVKFINNLAYYEAEKPNKDSFSFAADSLRRLSPDWVQKIKILLYRIPPVHYAVSIKKGLEALVERC